MKKLLLFTFLATAFITAKAQRRDEDDTRKVFLSAGPEVGLPSSSPFDASYGASAKVEVRVVKHFSLTLTGQYTAYDYKNSFTSFIGQTTQLHPSFIPLKAGVKYYLGPNFYAEGEIGNTVSSNYGTANNMFDYTIGFGFEARLNSFSDIDIDFHYDQFTQTQYQVTGLRVAYRVGW